MKYMALKALSTLFPPPVTDMVLESQLSQIVLQSLPLLKNTFVDIKTAQYLLPLCQIRIHGAEVTISVNNQLDSQFFFIYLCNPIIYMSRATKCSSSGESIVSIRPLVYVTLCRLPYGIQV